MSDNAVEISFRADLADLESGTTEAVALIGRAADAILRIAEESSLKQIAIEEDKNDFLYRMGEESLDQWQANATAGEDAKYEAELAFLEKKAAVDSADAAAEARDLESRAVLYEAHTLALQKIDEQYAERKRALDQQELQDFIANDNAKLSDSLRSIAVQYDEHKVGADRRFALEQQLTNKIYGEELQRLNAVVASLAAGTKAYEDAIKAREKVEQEFTKQSEANTDRLAQEEAAKWTQLGNSIRSAFNSAIDGLLFQGNTFKQFMLNVAEGILKAFLEMGETIAENWIETQIAAMIETKTTQGTTALGQVADAAGVAGANAYAAYAAMPPVAAAMAAEAVAATMGFSSLIALDTGAWDLKADTIAQLHKGEMVVPQNFASGLRANGGAMGGNDVSLNYAPTINSREQATLGQMLSAHGHEMHAWIRREFRNGALRA
ncbi:MAG TPA: hypothetical protein VGL35_12005 [Rhizomicrobium sp.]|jgi:hypothetical protein